MREIFIYLWVNPKLNTMSANFDQYYDRLLSEHLSDDHKCPECDRPVENEGDFCSSNCFDASMR